MYLKHRESGHCLQPEGGSAEVSDIVPLVLGHHCGLKSQEFVMNVRGNATYSFMHQNSAKCIQPKAALVTDGVPLVLAPSCSGPSLVSAVFEVLLAEDIPENPGHLFTTTDSFTMLM